MALAPKITLSAQLSNIITTAKGRIDRRMKRTPAPVTANQAATDCGQARCSLGALDASMQSVILVSITKHLAHARETSPFSLTICAVLPQVDSGRTVTNSRI